MTETRRLQYSLAPALARRAAIGLLALSTDATVEAEWRALLNVDGVEFYTGRVLCDDDINPESLTAMQSRLAAAAGALLPGSELDVLAYACTSASLLIGEDAVAGELHRVRPGIPVTTPLTAAKTALERLGARRIALLTPYVEDINQRLRDHLEQFGFDVAVMGSFLNGLDPEVVRIEPRGIEHAVHTLGQSEEIDGVFVACTALRASALVPVLEASLDCPVTTSNHAMAWHVLRLAGVDDRIENRGRLFRL